MAGAQGIESLLSTAQELARLGSWEQDLSTGGTLWSQEMYRILGLEPAGGELAVEELLAFIHPDDRERVRSILAAVQERPEEVPPNGLTGELRGLRADGAVRFLRFHATVERDAEGRPARWVGCIQDVTEQRVSERELEAHYAVSQALREWESFEDGVLSLLERIGNALEYPMGSLWLCDEDEGALVCRAFWSADDINSAPFEYAKRTLKFRPGEGKPGCAWQAQEPVVTPDAVTDPVFQPREAAVLRGIHSGVAFPAVGPDGPLLVLSFYSFEHRVPSPSIVRTLSAIGHELGHFLSRHRMGLRPRPVSDREREVLQLAAEGNSGRQIAEHLFVSPETVKTHLENVYEKLGVSDRASAVANGLRTGLIR